jgi:hypothetical protein
MNLPGFAAEDSLYISSGQYQSVATRAILSGQVLPTGNCCSECAEIICQPCSPLDREIRGRCEALMIQCNEQRQACYANCVDCSPHRQPCCPYDCKGTCPF